MKKNTGLELELSGVVTRDSVAGCYLSECVQLGVASAGKTIEEAKEALQDAVTGFLHVCLDRGTLDKVLRDRGVVLNHFNESTRMFVIPKSTPMFVIPTDRSLDRAVRSAVPAA